MKKALLILFALLSLAGCAKNEDNPNMLTGIGMPVFEGYPTLYETDDGYYALDYTDTTYYYSVLTGEAEAERYLKIYNLDENGAVLGETTLYDDPIASPIGVCERGFYMRSGETLYFADWSGKILAEADGIGQDAMFTVSDGGAYLADGKHIAVYDENLAETASYELETKPEDIAAEGNELWIIYKQKEDKETVTYLGKLSGGTVSESYRLPDKIANPQSVSTHLGDSMLACEDGWLYGWKGNIGIYRWKYADESEEPVLETVVDFMNSAIVIGDITNIKKMPGEDSFIVTTRKEHPYLAFTDSDPTYTLIKKAPDRDLSEMTVLTLACALPSKDMQKAVTLFNRDHEDAYIRIVSYEEYGTQSYGGGVGFSPNDVYDRMEIDLNSGLLKADILLDCTVDPIDLYPYMTGEIKPEDIAGCVKNTFETDGQLKKIGAEFGLRSIAGKSENLGGMTSWTLEEFLDYCDSLGDDEYIMDQLSRDNRAWSLFGINFHANFIRDGEAHFDDGLYVRYLEHLASLPKEPLELMDYSASILGQVIAGEITPDQADNMTQAESDGTNLYYENRIKLLNPQIARGLTDLRGLFDTMKYFDSEDITFIGYPTNGESGTTVYYSGDTYSIQSSCEYPELAWEFIESAILAGSSTPDVDTLSFRFTTLKNVYMQYLESMRGYKFFESYDKVSTNEGRDITPSKPGVLREVNDNVIRILTDLYDNAGNTDSVYSEVRQIAEEEESRFLAGVISAEECADIVQSRVSIYLAERS